MDSGNKIIIKRLKKRPILRSGSFFPFFYFGRVQITKSRTIWLLCSLVHIPYTNLSVHHKVICEGAKMEVKKYGIYEI